MTDFIAKIIHNKRNNQLAIVLSRKKLNIMKNKIPKLIELKVKKLRFHNDR